MSYHENILCLLWYGNYVLGKSSSPPSASAEVSKRKKWESREALKLPLLLLCCSSWAVLHPRKHMLSNQQLWQLLLWPSTWQKSKISFTFPFVLSILVLTIWFRLLEGTLQKQLCLKYFQIRLLGLMQGQWANRWLTRQLCQIFRECFGTSTRLRKGLSASKVIMADYRHSMKSIIKHKFCTYPTFSPEFRINFCSLLHPQVWAAGWRPQQPTWVEIILSFTRLSYRLLLARV